MSTPGLSDPARCPTTASRTDCSTQFTVVNGGNPALTPEESTNATLDLVLQPTSQVTPASDAFRIRLTDTISNGLTPATILGDPMRYGHLVARGAVGPAFPSLPGPISGISQTNIDLGEVKLSGVDLDATVTFPDVLGGRVTASRGGTYFHTYDVQNPDGTFSTGLDVANTATGGVVPQWRHFASLDWSGGSWGVTWGQSWQKGYHDLAPTGGTPLRRVNSYERWDLQLRYKGFKDLELRAGVRNLFDKDPPYSNAGGQTSFQGGYDPAYADPRGRY